MVWLRLITKISSSSRTSVRAGFLVKLKKQFPLFWNIVCLVFWQNLEALVA